MATQQTRAMNFAENFVNRFMQAKALQFQRELALRQEERYDRQLEENAKYRQETLGIQREQTKLAQQRYEEGRALDVAKFGQSVKQYEETLDFNRQKYAESIERFGRDEARKQAEHDIDMELKGYEAETLRSLSPEERVAMLKRGTSITFGQKPAPQGEREAIQQYRSLKDTANRARELWKGSYTGPIQGSELAGKIKEATGAMTDDEAKFRLNMKGLIRKMYADAGKQLSDKEWDRLSQMMPRMNTADNIWQAQMDEFLYQIERDLTLKERGLEESGYIVPGKTTLFPSTETVDMNDVDMSDFEDMF